MTNDSLEAAIDLATKTGKADRRQIEDLLSGERARVRAVVEILPQADLEWALGIELGEHALRNAFDLMPQYYIPGSFDREISVRYHVSRPPGSTIVQDVLFGPQTCRLLTQSDSHATDLSVFLTAIGFVRIATGLAKGTDLLMRGELNVQGDVQAAMRMEAFFGLAEPKGAR